MRERALGVLSPAGLHRLLIATVLVFAVHLLAENSADPDLWGHVLFGRRLLAGGLERVEPFSWTARGAPWINHELLAEAALAGAHQLGGGTGILLLKVGVGFVAFGLALGLALRRMAPSQRPVAWLFAASALPEIAFGFAARPQIFTALFLVCELWLLEWLCAGPEGDRRYRTAWLMPLLCAVWVNTHGGVLLGLLLFAAAGGVWAAGVLWGGARTRARVLPGPLVVWGAALVLSVVALGVNPWGWRLPLWLVQSVSWIRPEIEEWNPTRLGWDHAPFFVVLAASLWAVVAARGRMSAWRLVVLGMLALAAVRHVRHTPLFALAALALVPPYLAAALAGLASHAAGLAGLGQSVPGRRMLVFGMLAWMTASAVGVLGGGKRHPWTVEVPGDVYPVEAVDFLRGSAIRGDALVFFDWGELMLWALPGCPPSIDGRLDTCYPRDVIEANWRFYRGQAPDPRVMDLSRARVALVPPWLPATATLLARPPWTPVFSNATAMVFVSAAEHGGPLQVNTNPVRRVPFDHWPPP